MEIFAFENCRFWKRLNWELPSPKKWAFKPSFLGSGWVGQTKILHGHYISHALQDEWHLKKIWEKSAQGLDQSPWNGPAVKSMKVSSIHWVYVVNINNLTALFLTVDIWDYILGCQRRKMYGLQVGTDPQTTSNDVTAPLGFSCSIMMLFCCTGGLPVKEVIAKGMCLRSTR